VAAFEDEETLAACALSRLLAPESLRDEQSTSPYATAADFAKYAMKLREQALLKVEPQVFIRPARVLRSSVIPGRPVS